MSAAPAALAFGTDPAARLPRSAFPGADDAAGEPWWSPGVVGGLPTGEPAWAVFVRDAVAAAPREVVVGDRPYPGLSGFGPIVAPFVEAAAERLRAALAADGSMADGSGPGNSGAA